MSDQKEKEYFKNVPLEDWLSPAKDDQERSILFLRFYVERILKHLKAKPLQLVITDGPGDGGLDGYVVDKDAKEVLLFQSKCPQKETTLKKKDATDLLDYYSSLLKKNQKGLKGKSRAFVSEFNTSYTGYQIKLYYLIYGKLHKKAVAAYNSIKSTDEFLEISMAKMAAEYYSALTQAVSVENEEVFMLPRSKYYEQQVRTESGQSYRVIQFPLFAESLLKAFKDKGDELFIYNLRFGLSTKINNQLKDSASSSSRHLFYMLHNGISITCQKFQYFSPPDVSNQLNEFFEQQRIGDSDVRDYIRNHPGRDFILLKDMQIVNGAQTTVTLSQVDIGKLEAIIIPCKVTETSEKDLARDIAVANNTQNRINPPDLVANTSQQIVIQSIARDWNPPIFYQRKRKEEWALVSGTNGITEPPRIRRIYYPDTFQAYASFRGTPGIAYTSKARVAYPETEYYKQAIRETDKRWIILAGLIANYEADSLKSDTSASEMKKYWLQWSIAVFGHLVRNHLDEKQREEILRELMSSTGLTRWKTIRKGVAKIIEGVMKTNFKVKDYQKFFKYNREVFDLNKVYPCQPSDIAKYVSPEIVQIPDFKEMRKKQPPMLAKYDVNFGIFAYYVDTQLDVQGMDIPKIMGFS